MRWGRVTIYNIVMINKLCKRCGAVLTGKQINYCSKKCSKLFLKSLYKKRNREKINEYNRKYRKLGIRGNPCTNQILKEFLNKYPSCEKCGTLIDINIAHVKPRWSGGRNRDNLITLCKKHHREFDEALRAFWGNKI